MRDRGFTLLEVMVAVAILGLSLTVILSAQTGLYAAMTHAKNETVAIGMARCKMGEIEEELLRLGYQETDVMEEGECCEDQTPARVRCKWKIERVELPDPPTFDEMNPAGDGAGLDLSTPNTDLSSGMPGGAGALGVLANLGTSGGSALQSGGGIGALGSMLGDASGGVAGLAPMVMSIVYPSLKPMLEASIRKISVTVLWKEGINDRELAVVQYVTNPMRGGLGMGMEGAETDLLSGAFGPSESGATEPSGRTPRVSPMATSRGK